MSRIRLRSARAFSAAIGYPVGRRGLWPPAPEKSLPHHRHFGFSKHTASATPMHPTISVANLSKTYASGYQALKSINLDIRRGEIFALLGPNGAGKTTLINIICGIVTASQGAVRVDGRDIGKDYRIVRAMIGLVPQELTTDAFETVGNPVSYSRALFGKPSNPAYVEKVLKELTLWSRKDSKI